jgi:NADPH:quinone reductase-like Zn-dependent oxidoreductase
MRQVYITKAGGPEVLQVRESPDPTPKAGEIRVRVAYAGVNYADIMARLGIYPDAPPIPCVVGYEVSGTVDQVGPGVTGFAEGDRVVTFSRFGGYADTVCVPAIWARQLSSAISYEQAAAIPVNYATAWIMLVREGNVQPGDLVLVHAAAGGVGQAALQICLSRGATVIGTASASKHARLRELGVSHCIDYTREDFEKAVMAHTNGRGVDVVLDAVGGNSFRKSYRCLAPLGRLFCFGASSASTGTRRDLIAAVKAMITMPFFHPMPLMNQNRGVFGTNMGHLWEVMERLQPDMDEILRLVEAGTFHPVVDRVFPLAEAGAAHIFMQERRNFGKVLLQA